MADSKTNLLKILNDTKGLSKIVSSSTGYTVKMFIDDVNYLYGTSMSLSEAREYFRDNDLNINSRKLKIETLHDYLKYLQKLNKLAEESKKRPKKKNTYSRDRSSGNPRKGKGGKGRIVHYGKTMGSI